MVIFHYARLVRRFIQVALCSLLATGIQPGLSVAYAQPHGTAQCRLNRALPGGAGDRSFGAGEVAVQNFALGVPARVCALRLWLRRDVRRAQAGPVILTLAGGTSGNLLFIAAVPAGAVPEDAASAVTFSFGCEGFDPPHQAAYTLELSSPGSAPGAYIWAGDDSWNLLIYQLPRRRRDAHRP